MKRTSLIIIGFTGVLVLIAALAAWYLVDSSQRIADSVTTEGAVDDFNGLAIYTNGTHGFTLYYPEDAAVAYGFEARYHLGSLWRVNALPQATGTPIVSFTTYSTKSDTSYPRYFDALVRVGASNDPKEIAQCLKPVVDQGETALPDTTIGPVVWKTFSFQNAAMQQYVRGVSYRTIHNGTCYALEKIAVGSNYREEASPNDIPEETLDAEFAALDSIIATFSFVRP